MVSKIIIKRLLRWIGLLAVVPLIVAHGVGSDDSFDCVALSNCDNPDPVEYYTLRGYQALYSDIRIGNNFKFTYLELEYTSPPESAGKTVPFIEFKPKPNSQDRHALNVVINNPIDDPATAHVGGLGLDGMRAGEVVKLLHDAAPPSSLQLTFELDSNIDFHVDPNPHIASSSSYMLSGGTNGSQYFQLDGIVKILVNGENIYQRDIDFFGVAVPPIAFSASPGDSLRIIAKKAADSDHHLTSLWLFDPEGRGTKLYHRGIVGFEVMTDDAFLDLLFIIP